MASSTRSRGVVVPTDARLVRVSGNHVGDAPRPASSLEEIAAHIAATRQTADRIGDELRGVADRVAGNEGESAGNTDGKDATTLADGTLAIVRRYIDELDRALVYIDRQLERIRGI